MLLTLFKIQNSLISLSSSLKRNSITENHFVCKYLLVSQNMTFHGGYILPLITYQMASNGFLITKHKNKSKMDIILLFISRGQNREADSSQSRYSKSPSFLPSFCSFVIMSYTIAVLLSFFVRGRNIRSGPERMESFLSFPHLTGQLAGLRSQLDTNAFVIPPPLAFLLQSLVSALLSRLLRGLVPRAHMLSLLRDMTFTIVQFSTYFSDLPTLKTSLSLYRQTSEILQVQFQPTIIKQVSQKVRYTIFFVSQCLQKLFTLYCSLLCALS